MVLADLGRKINSALRSLTTAAIVDEQLLDGVLREVCAALLEADVNVRLVQGLRKNIKSIVNLQELAVGVNKKRVVQKAVFDELIRLVDPGGEPFRPRKGRPNVVMLVGLQGSGKTTTCTKLAHHYQRKGLRTCLVCTDTFRAGAFDQLKQNAIKAKIPYYGSYSESDPVQLAQEGVGKFKAEGFEVIIVDTSGRHRQETELFAEMRQISDAIVPDNVIFVLDGTIGQAADAHARAFRETVPIGSIVITKMDGHAKGGGAISAVAATGSPIEFIGTGEHVADLEPFKPQSFVSRMLGMGDLGGLLETVKDLQMDKSDLVRNLEQGVFNLRSMQQQLSFMSSMGPMSKLAGMLPGMPQEMLSMLNDGAGASRMKRLTVIFDSMTDAELDSDGKLFYTQPERIRRLARGSGSQIEDVHMLLVQFKPMADMVKTMGDSRSLLSKMKNSGGGPVGLKPSEMAQVAKMRNQMSNLIPQGMLGQLAGGGMPNIQNMMQQMGLGGAGGGMPDMSAIANMLGGAGGLGGLGGLGGPPGRSGGRGGARTIRRK